MLLVNPPNFVSPNSQLMLCNLNDTLFFFSNPKYTIIYTYMTDVKPLFEINSLI